MNYKFKMSNGHPIIRIDENNFVVDTGSPISFFTRREGNIIISEELCYLPQNPLGVDVDAIEKFIGEEIDGFIGLDVLKKISCIKFDKPAGVASFSVIDRKNAKAVIPLSEKNVMGMSAILVPATIDGLRCNAILDTGATIGYAHSNLLRKAECIGQSVDYAPSFGGEIVADKYKVSLNIGDVPCDTAFAKMTDTLELMLGLLGCQLIVGLNDMKWDVLSMDFISYEMMIA